MFQTVLFARRLGWFGISSLIFVTFLGACSDGSGLRFGAKLHSLFQDDDLGMPEGGLADRSSSLTSLLDENGADMVAETKADSKIVTHVANAKEIVIPKASRMLIVAENGDWYRVLTKIATPEGIIQVEGFISKTSISMLGRQSHGVDLMFPKLAQSPAPRTTDPSADEINAELLTRESPIDLEMTEGKAVTPGVEVVPSDYEKGEGSGVVVSEPIKVDEKPTYSVPAEVVAGPTQVTPPEYTPEVATNIPKSNPEPVEATPETPREKENKDEKPSCKSARLVFQEERSTKRMECSDGKDVEKCVVPGEILREPSKRLNGRLAVIEMKGKADQWEIDVAYQAQQSAGVLQRMGNVNGGGHLVKNKVIPARKESDVTEVPVQDVVPDNGLVGGNRTFYFTPRLEGKKGESCKIVVGVVSPVVLELSGSDLVSDLGPTESGVRFDLLGNGIAVQTGWVRPEMGFLARDVDGDGVISSGRELFGEGTLAQNGTTFENGYQALAQLDTNLDGMISSTDAQFAELLVWRDGNADGVSQSSEISPLSVHGIESLSLSYGPSLRHGVPSIGENDVRFEARYFGPKRCGQEGCLSFDIFFSTVQSLASQ